ncbi:MAG: GntR family transcriptional regulator [Lachnospiraceae bacterium]|nr:GntR family transcriptional regulator [Lachnospiraceae bacterium]
MIELNLRDSRPIYEQIGDSYKKLIISGVLKPDEKMPSVRTLAQQLSINPNTIQRAYNELEAAGFVYSIPGKGSFVCEMEDFNKEHIAELKVTVRTLIEELRLLKVSDEEIYELMGKGECNDRS